MNLSIREIEIRDIHLIADYWLLSDKDFLVGMGVDLERLPTRENFTQMLTAQIHALIEEKKSYAFIWEIDGKPVGHSNVNQIQYGEQAMMHLHLWQSQNRKKGAGLELVKMTIPHFFEALQLKTLYCQPYAHNPAPNKTLEKVGFEFVKSYKGIPGSWSFEQEINQWRMTKEQFKKLL